MRKVILGSIAAVALLLAAGACYVAYLGHKLALVENAPGVSRLDGVNSPSNLPTTSAANSDGGRVALLPDGFVPND